MVLPKMSLFYCGVNSEGPSIKDFGKILTLPYPAILSFLHWASPWMFGVRIHKAKLVGGLKTSFLKKVRARVYGWLCLQSA